MADQKDPREEAFEALLPAALPTQDALRRVDEAVKREQEQVKALRKSWSLGQRNQSFGFSRFVYAVDDAKQAWAQVPGFRYASTRSQEESNLFLWTVGDRWPLRIKHEPIEGTVNTGARPLFHLPVQKGEPTVFLTWDESEERTIIRPRFVTAREPKWSISVAQLVAAAERPDSIGADRPAAGVTSARESSGKEADKQP